MWAMAITDVSIKGGIATSDIDMGAYKFKTNHITESTTSHGVVFDVTPNLGELGSYLLISGTTVTAFSKAAEMSHNANTDKLVAYVPIPWWVSPRSIAKVAYEAKTVGGNGYLSHQLFHKSLPIDTVILLSDYQHYQTVGTLFNDAAYTAKTKDVPLCGGSYMLFTLRASAGTAYIRNLVVSYDVSGLDPSGSTGWLGGL